MRLNRMKLAVKFGNTYFLVKSICPACRRAAGILYPQDKLYFQGPYLPDSRNPVSKTKPLKGDWNNFNSTAIKQALDTHLFLPE